MLAPDGLVVYDIQDEPGPSGQAATVPVSTHCVGINVESVSIRRSEVEASVELYRRLSAQLER
ncbi:MAG: hypothetical protein ACRD3J_08905 [Thermoanaerobaculia bacterium]